MSNKTKNTCTPSEWAEIKAKARADLEARLAAGLPHSSEPLAEVRATDPEAAAKAAQKAQEKADKAAAKAQEKATAKAAKEAAKKSR